VRLLEEVRAREPGLVEELIPQLLSVSDLQKVLQHLVSEQVSISALDLIIEHLIDLARGERDPGALAEALRQRLGHAICSRLRDRHRDLAVLSLDPRLENQLAGALAVSGRKDAMAIDPRLAEKLLRKLGSSVSDMLRQGREPVLLCGGEIRRPIRALTRRALPKLAILSVNEIPTNIELRSFAVIRTDDEEPRREPRTETGARTSLNEARIVDGAAFS
jgi:flagellar biosynthesis protein FlhA